MTATPEQLAFSSEYNTHKVKVQGTTTVTIPSGQTGDFDASVAHSIGYKPVHSVWAKFVNNENRRYQMPFVEFVVENDETSGECWVDSTNINFRASSVVSRGYARNVVFSYFVMIDPVT